MPQPVLPRVEDRFRTISTSSRSRSLTTVPAGMPRLLVAARLERDQDMDGATPVNDLDVEAGFRMALALVELPEELSGVCALRLKLDGRREDPPSGVTARIERGRVVSCEAGFEQNADALVNAIHPALFGPRRS